MTPADLDRIHPTAARVVVHLDPGAQETPGGLIIPPQYQQITQHGRVCACGPDCTLVGVQSTVLLDLNAGTRLGWLDNTPVLLVDEADIQAVLTDM